MLGPRVVDNRYRDYRVATLTLTKHTTSHRGCAALFPQASVSEEQRKPIASYRLLLTESTSMSGYLIAGVVLALVSTVPLALRWQLAVKKSEMTHNNERATTLIGAVDLLPREIPCGQHAGALDGGA